MTIRNRLIFIWGCKAFDRTLKIKYSHVSNHVTRQPLKITDNVITFNPAFVKFMSARKVAA